MAQSATGGGKSSTEPPRIPRLDLRPAGRLPHLVRDAENGGPR